ncbi:MAG: hypothetical protein JSV84_16910 [Gemmatimonadota bacterium]|nr:MAG: hypothetical protein JSV84_16910 [Gemmatimonadota bacterium]
MITVKEIFRRRHFILVCIGTVFFLSAGSRAEFLLERDVPEFRVLASDNSGTEIALEIPEPVIEDIFEGGEKYQKVRLSRAGWRTEAGRPELPVLARLVAVPPGVSVDVEVDLRDSSILSDIRMWPHQEERTEKRDERPFLMSREFYAQDAFYPEPAAEVGSAVMVRDLCLVPLILHPVQYNPVREEVKVCRRLTVKLTYKRSENSATPKRRSLGRPEAFEKLYRSSIVNYTALPSSQEVVRGGYLIITPDAYYEALEPLVEWKRQKGHHTEMVKLSRIGSNPSNNLIRIYIQDYYESASVPLEYVILVGDVDEMPTFYYDDGLEWVAADHPYCMLEGEDYFPDVFVGRLSVSSVNEMRTVANKIVSYERNPYMGRTNWYKRALMICNYEGNASTRTLKLWVREKLLDNGFTQVDTSFTFPGYECDVGYISAVVNSGVAFVNYRGWMDWGGWTSAYQTPADLDNIYGLHNGFMLPVVTDMVCNAADFNEDCPAEAWLRAGTVSFPRGAVAIIGPTSMFTFVNYNNVLDAGFYAGVFDDSLFTVGQAFARAKMELYMQYPHNRGPGNTWNSVECYFYIYTLIGDPGLVMWTDIPNNLFVDHPSVIGVGTNQLFMTVENSDNLPVDGAYVCLTAGGRILSGGYTEPDGRITLPVSVGENDSVLVTVTKHNFKPYQTILLGQEVPVCVSLSNHHIDDDSLGESSGDGDGKVNPGETMELILSLRNAGVSRTAFSVSAEIAVDDSYGAVHQSIANFGDIPPGSDVAGQEEYVISITPDCPDGHVVTCTIEIVDGSGTLWEDFLDISVEAPDFSLHSFHIEDSSQTLLPNRLDPGETGSLVVTITNEGKKVGKNVRATLRTSDPNIVLIDSRADFGTIMMESQGDNSENPFIISAHESMFPGHQVHFTLYVESNSEMRDVVMLPVTVGLATPSDPSGPDSYGYFAYDSFDWRYYDRPNYEWIEIDPLHGGAGAVLNLIDDIEPGYYTGENYPQGDTEVLPLPFAFRYYGNTYDEVSVCSNGWLSFGATWMTNFRNWSIPAVLNPPCLVAPFWDDLYMGNGCVVYFNDEQEHRFVVEWSRIYNDYDDAEETFQVVLYDPEYYPTPTGDGEIVFQYRAVSNSDYAGNFATVGIESPDKKGGLEYTYAGQYVPGAQELSDHSAIKFTTNTEFPSNPHTNLCEVILDDDSVGLSTGDGDSLVDIGEVIELSIRLFNLGGSTAQDVTAILRSSDTSACVQDSIQTFPDLPPRETAVSEGPFVVAVAPDCEHGYEIPFEVVTAIWGSFCSKTAFNIEVVAPIITYETCTLNEVEGDGDGRPEAGEVWELRIQLRNVGGGQATDVRGVLRTEDEYLSLLSDSADFPEVEADSSCTNWIDPFVFRLSNETPYHYVSFHLSIFSNGDYYGTTLRFEVLVGQSAFLLVDDDGGDSLEIYFEAACDMEGIGCDLYDRLSDGMLDTSLIYNYEAVIWFTGNECDSTLTPSDQEWLKTFLDNGGGLFMTGQNIAADLRESPFLRNYLHVRFLADRSEDIWLYSVPGDPITGELDMLSLCPGDLGADNQDSPDVIEPLNGASSILIYYGSGETAALRYRGGYRVIYFAVGFESLIEFYDVANVSHMRAEMLGRILDWFGVESQIGDVNEVGRVNILDVVWVIHIILASGEGPTEYQLWSSDYTGDGQVNILDVVGIVNVILGSGACSY